jgi:hypothetical protein
MVTGYATVKGCKDANKFLGNRQSYCEDCPFNECIYDLKPKEKALIMKFDIIQGILKWFDAGLTPEQIHSWYPKISLTQIRNWLKNRDRVTAKLERYAPC